MNNNPNYTHDWFTHNIPFVSGVLNQYYDYDNKVVSMLEIGCYEGKSTTWFLEHILRHKDSHITVMDTFTGSSDIEKQDYVGVEDRFRVNVAPYKSKVTIEKGPSFLSLIGYIHYGHELFDIIYVDGSHTAPDVLTDAIMAFQLLKPGGIMIFDDYRWNSPNFKKENAPKIAIDSFAECFADKLQYINAAYQYAIKKL